MKIDISGSEVITVSREQLWAGLNDPDLLTRCIPGCKSMTEIEPDTYKVEMQLRVAAVGGTFEGDVALSQKEPPDRCVITVSGVGTLGNGKGNAHFVLSDEPGGKTLLTYKGSGEVGGLVAGVGQRILGSVSKHLTGRFFAALRKEYENAPAEQSAG